MGKSLVRRIASNAGWSWALIFLFAAAPNNLRAQWEILSSGTTADFRGIANVGQGIAWASGTQGTVLRTTNDGKDWQRCATPPDADKLDFRGIQAFDAKTAIVMSSGKGPLSRLYKTTDACQTWTLLFTNPDPEGFWDAVRAGRTAQGLEILIIGDPVNGRFATFQSTYDATRLEKFDAGGLTALEGEGAFAASNSSSEVNLNRLTEILGTGGPLGARVLVLCPSCPGHGGWNGRRLDGFTYGKSAGIFSVANWEKTWVVVGGDYLAPNSAIGNAAFSLDDGKSWSIVKNSPHGYRSAVAYDAANKTWITVGPNGTDISTDDGRNWRALKPSAAEPLDADQHWNALSLPFVVGPHGRIGKLRPDALKSASFGAKP